MLGWTSKSADNKRWVDPATYASITGSLAHLYREKLKPLEEDYLYSKIHAPPLADGDFTAKPMILVMGQYSTGKTTFIRHFLERDYPDIRIGPEPTTDNFVCVMGGPNDQVVPGNAVVIDHNLPFTQLSHVGTTFFKRFQASICKSQVLDAVSFIDTPGVLSGGKQRHSRGYDYEEIAKWFADRVDMIILLFDAHSLDISDEFHRVISGISVGNVQKVRIVLNKADRVTKEQLLRVHGALMWALRRVFDSPEVPRVYIGSFWGEKLYCDEWRSLFESDSNQLYMEVAKLPKNGALRQVNDLIKRIRNARVNAAVLNHLRTQLRGSCGSGVSSAKRKRLISELPEIFTMLSEKHGIPRGDFPDVDVFESVLNKNLDISRIPVLDQKKLDLLEEMLVVDIPHVIRLLPMELAAEQSAHVPFIPPASNAKSSSVAADNGGKTKAGDPYRRGYWLSQPPNVDKYEDDFNALKPKEGLVDGDTATAVMGDVSKLPSSILHQVSKLADMDEDGYFTLLEFSIARHLVEMKLEGHELPSELPRIFRTDYVRAQTLGG